MTDAVVVSVPEFGLASVAARAAARFAPIGAQSARAAAPATRVFLSAPGLIVAARAAAGLAAVFALAAFPVAEYAVAAASDLVLTFSARSRPSAGPVSAFALAAFPVAERAVAAASDLVQLFFEPDPAADLPFAVAAFHPLRVFALPARFAALRPQGRSPASPEC